MPTNDRHQQGRQKRKGLKGTSTMKGSPPSQQVNTTANFFKKRFFVLYFCRVVYVAYLQPEPNIEKISL